MLNMLMMLSVQVVLNSLACYHVKIAPSYFSWVFALGIFLFVTTFALWIYMLRAYPLSIVVPLVAAFNIILAQMIGTIWLGEVLIVRQMFGAGMIVLGIFLVTWKAAL